MSTVYSLVCWGGRTGKTVTLTIASPCVVTSTSHGLRDGTGLRFKANGDTLPTGLTSGVTYYAKSTADNTFNLYSDAGLTTIINTSGTQSGTHIMQSLLVADPSNALAPYGLSDLSRWGSSGSERIYDGLVSWNSGRSGAGKNDTEVCEIGDSFDEIKGTRITFNIPSVAITVETRINGIRTAGFHEGIIGNGYIFKFSASNEAFYNSKYNAIFDGVSIECIGQGSGFFTDKPGVIVNKCIFISSRTVANTDGFGLYLQLPLSKFTNNIVIGFNDGLYLFTYGYGLLVANNISVKNNRYGVACYGTAGAGHLGFLYNNIAIGNATANWIAKPSGVEGATNNAGSSTDATWVTTGGAVVNVATTDFIDYVNNDFRPALSSSPQVDSGITYYGIGLSDIADAEAPNYNNGGAEAYDIGAYEYDHGYGPHPASHELTITNVVVGSRIAIRDQANTTTLYDQIAAASTVVIPLQVYAGGSPLNNWRIRIRKSSAAPKYLPYETLMTATPGASSIYVSQLPDPIAS